MNRQQLMLGGLALGMALGLLARVPALGWLGGVIDLAQPLGALWVRALRMTLVPLIFALVTQGMVQAAGHHGGGRLVLRTLRLMLGLLAAGALLASATVLLVLWAFPLPPHPLAGLIAGPVQMPAIPGAVEQLLAIIPENPVAAAAQGQVLPLVVFAMLFGLACARLSRRADGAPALLAALLGDLAGAMMVLVEWILLPAPLAILVLASGTARTAGLGVAGVLARYVGAMVLYCCLAGLACYLLVGLSRAMPLGRFARALLPAQATAAGSCSSMASAPVMLDVAQGALALPESVVGTVLPLAISTFRLATIGYIMISVILGGLAAEVPAGAGQWAMALLAALLGGLATPGLPGAAVIYAGNAPAFQILGAPLGLIPLYIAVFALPDIFITTGNVTGQLTLGTLIARRVER